MAEADDANPAADTPPVDDADGPETWRFTGSVLAHAVRAGWCCRNCGGGFCIHISPSRCPSCGARDNRGRRKRPEPEPGE